MGVAVRGWCVELFRDGVPPPVDRCPVNLGYWGYNELCNDGVNVFAQSVVDRSLIGLPRRFPQVCLAS